jgi:hypothetical protein
MKSRCGWQVIIFNSKKFEEPTPNPSQEGILKCPPLTPPGRGIRKVDRAHRFDNGFDVRVFGFPV